MDDRWTRRSFLATGAAALAGAALTPPGTRGFAGNAPGPRALGRTPAGTSRAGLPFLISLAQWSLHRTLRAGEMDHLDFAARSRERYGIEAIEYVNTFFRDHVGDAAYLAEMNRRAADHGVHQHLIMCDGEGRLGDPDPAARRTAVENHRRWVDAAQALGCASIRVNAHSEGSREEQQRLVADGLRQLCEYGDQAGLDVLVENHGGLSSDGAWLAGVMELVDHPRVGTLPDFGNFNLGGGEVYPIYQGVAELMPWAKAVSAKSHDFDDQGNETTKDYRRLMRIVTEAGYRSWVGIEYEGGRLSEDEGILATLRLLETIQQEMQER